jgi:hypothetical protein
MSEPTIGTGEEIKLLMQLAGIPLSKKPAVSWLKEALVTAHYHYQPRKRLSSADHNDKLDDLAKSSKRLLKQLRGLRSHPYTWLEFWSRVEPLPASDFRGKATSEDEVQALLRKRRHGHSRQDDAPILAILERVERASHAAKERRLGRPPDLPKQRVVDLAAHFLIRFSDLKLSGTATGQFARFARAFYSIALKLDPECAEGIDRQIREAAKHIPSRQ